MHCAYCNMYSMCKDIYVMCECWQLCPHVIALHDMDHLVDLRVACLELKPMMQEPIRRMQEADFKGVPLKHIQKISKIQRSWCECGFDLFLTLAVADNQTLDNFGHGLKQGWIW